MFKPIPIKEKFQKTYNSVFSGPKVLLLLGLGPKLGNAVRVCTSSLQLVTNAQAPPLSGARGQSFSMSFRQLSCDILIFDVSWLREKKKL